MSANVRIFISTRSRPQFTPTAPIFPNADEAQRYGSWLRKRHAFILDYRQDPTRERPNARFDRERGLVWSAAVEEEPA